MCYFIHFKVTAQRQQDTPKVLGAAAEIVGHHSLFIFGQAQTLTISKNGHCACDLVKREHKLDSSVIGFVKEMLQQNLVKSVEIGYKWTVPMPKDAASERVNVDEFTSLNDAFALRESVWYRVNDPSKYDFNRSATA